MRPTLRQLEYIVAVADLGQVGAAAVQLNVSQPSLSAQLAEVEADLGVKLFLRGRGGARATPVGAEIVRRARAILRDHQDLRAVVRGGGMFQGRLRLGVLPSIGPYLLPGVVRRLHDEHPSLRLVVRDENTRDLVAGLREGRHDLVISTAEDHPGAQQETLFREELWAAMPQDHALAATAGPLPLEGLRGQVLLTLGSGHRLSQLVAGLAGRAGARISEDYEGTSLDAIRLMAASGAGLAILPGIYAATEARRGTDLTLRRLKDASAVRQISLIQPSAHGVTPDSAALAGILRAEAARLLHGN